MHSEPIKTLSTVRWPFLEEPLRNQIEFFDDRSNTLSFARELVKRAVDYDAVIINGAIGFNGLYADLVASLFVRMRARPPCVVVADATWEVGSRALNRVFRRKGVGLRRLARTAIRAIDGRHVTYCVLSTSELETFPRLWGVDPARVTFTPYGCTRERLDEVAPEGDYVFAGGDSLRDYDLLVDAMRDLDQRLIIASRKRFDLLPHNVEARTVPHEEFVEQLWAAGPVVVPLASKTVRSAGQQTYINAMAWGKLVIVTDAPGVRDYIQDGQTGLIVPHDARALREAIRWATDRANHSEIAAISERARRTAQTRFTPLQYGRALLQAAREAFKRMQSDGRASHPSLGGPGLAGGEIRQHRNYTES
jgi:glycosyltransferase involved in cell wall biosynthesis